ncbi:MAG: subunit alpha of polymerase [Paenibacillaceae bacterium]|nr:subunit alpha of polymerase [Paenibacillaceae bacterium]
MRALFAHRQDALDNTLKVAELCNLELEFGRSILPQFRPIPDGLTAGEYLDALCREGLERRYAGTPRWEDVEGRQALTERLEYELGVIGTMGYSDYFLIVWDFIRFAHEQGIATGPGRGSSAGSLVAYVLEITDVDPIHYGLLFERFLNPERVSMPDIDIDFDDERRDEVIRYVMHKYGEDHVAQIITFGTMAARAAVRDVGRVMNVPYNEVDRAAKMISGHLTLPETLAENKELAALADKFPRTKEMLQMAMRVEGFPRHVSTHAAGVVISREPLTRYVPLQAGAEGGALTQYSMENLESIGLLKMDFLGLRTLSILGRTLRWIEESTGERVDLRRLPLDDPLTYEMLCRGETAGIFQFDAAYMRRVLKELQPSQFEDMISLNALNRPGPIEFIPKYIAAKHGEIAVEYPHPVLEPILRDTYGIIVYQEQIMQIAALMAGFSLGEADLLRRAVSKKKREVLDEERAHFVRGSLKQGYGEADANKVYDMIVRFADYGFPRAHATAYALVAFQTAYLKAHYPMEFMAAMLTAWMGSQRKTAEYVDECRHMKIAVLPPDVNESGVAFTPVRAREETGDDVAGAIRFGLAAIKNVGTQAIEAIMREREGKPFADLADFCRRVDLRVCNKRVIESLIMGGAMDAFPGHRAQLLAVLERQIESALKWRKEREDLQLHLFGFTEEVNWTIEYPEVTPFTRMQQLTMERELLGMFISGHPLDEYEGLLQELGTEPLHQLAEAADNSEVVTAGMVVSFKTFLTKKGQTMAYVELEDRVDKVEVVMFPDCWKQYGSMVAKERLLLVQGRIQQQDEAVKLLAGRVAPLDEPGAREAVLHWRRSARREPVQRNTASPSQNAAVRASASPTASNATARPAATAPGRRPAESSPRDTDAATSASAAAAKPRQPREAAAPAPQAEPRLAAASASRQRVFVKIGAARENEQALSSLQQLLKQHPGALDVILFYERDQRTLRLSDQYRIKPSPQLFQDIETLLGPQTVRVK